LISTTSDNLLLSDYFEHRADVLLAILFGSAARNNANFDSDMDIAVLTDTGLSVTQKERMIDEITRVAGRPIDLVDLHHAHGTLLRQILSHGTRLVCRNSLDLAGLIKRALFEQADFQPYIDRIHTERRKRWIGK
jgi:uncharacterized protein